MSNKQTYYLQKQFLFYVSVRYLCRHAVHFQYAQSLNISNNIKKHKMWAKKLFVV